MLMCMMHLMKRGQKFRSQGQCQNGWCRLCVIVNWMHLFLLELVLVLKNVSYASDCYALAVASLCDEKEPVSFDEAQNSENWMAAMQSEFDAIFKNGT